MFIVYTIKVSDIVDIDHACLTHVCMLKVVVYQIACCLGQRWSYTQLWIRHFTKCSMPLVTYCDRTCCHKVLFYVVNKSLLFDLSQCLCSRYHDIRKIGGK